MDNTIYMMLTDPDNYGTVLRQEGHKFFGFMEGEWRRRGLSIGYFLPDKSEYECYREITEEEAMELIKAMG